LEIGTRIVLLYFLNQNWRFFLNLKNCPTLVKISVNWFLIWQEPLVLEYCWFYWTFSAILKMIFWFCDIFSIEDFSRTFNGVHSSWKDQVRFYLH
jgi:hypothetical protein